MDPLDPTTCYQALRTRDARFDGRLFVGVVTTGIYCRPICPARPAQIENCRFFLSAAAAQEAGFRPCLRCRPEVAPDRGAWLGTGCTVSRALARIAEGALDGDGTVDALAARVGVGERQLRRLFDHHLGASPVAVASTRRVLFAKQLVHDTQLPMSEIAVAAGFGSLRRFNETFRTLFGRPPSALRREGAAGDAPGGAVVLHLPYRPPFAWDALLGWFAGRAIAGVEGVADGVYRRLLAVDDEVGVVEVRHAPARNALAVTVSFPSVRPLSAIAARVRRVFDLGADVTAIGAHLAQDPLLAPMVAERPGLRVPGGWDGFELGVRAILGQQVSVRAARQRVQELVASCGRRVDGVDAAGLDHLFPRPEDVVAHDLRSLGVPGARRAALVALAEAALADPGLFEPLPTVEATVERLTRIKGVGPWTAAYVALRAAREPDAFPASDVGILRGAASAEGRPTPAALEARAAAWRPWRAYAAQHLWAADAARSEVNP